MTDFEKRKQRTESITASIDRWVGMAPVDRRLNPREKLEIREACEATLRMLPDAEFSVDQERPVAAPSGRLRFRFDCFENRERFQACALVSGSTDANRSPHRLQIRQAINVYLHRPDVGTETKSEILVDIGLRQWKGQYWVSLSILPTSYPVPLELSGCTFRLHFQDKHDISSSVELVVYESQTGIVTSKETMLTNINADSAQELWCTDIEITETEPTIHAAASVEPATMPPHQPFDLRGDGKSVFAFPAVLLGDKPAPLPSFAADEQQQQLISQLPTGGICQGLLTLHPSSHLCQTFRGQGYVNEQVFQQLVRWIQLRLGWLGSASLRACNCWSAPERLACANCPSPANELPPRIFGESFMLSVTISLLDALCGRGHGLPKGMIATGGFSLGSHNQSIKVAHLASKIEQCLGISAADGQRQQSAPCHRADTEGRLTNNWLQKGDVRVLLTGINTDWFDQLESMGLEVTESSIPAEELRRQLASGECTNRPKDELLVVMVRDLQQALHIVADAIGLPSGVLEALQSSPLCATASQAITCYRLQVRRPSRKRFDDIQKSISWMFNEIYERRGRHSSGLSQCCEILRKFVEAEGKLVCHGCQIGYFSNPDQTVKVIGQSTEEGFKFPAQYKFDQGLFRRVFAQQRLAVFSYGEGVAALPQHFGVSQKSLEATSGFPLRQGFSVHMPVIARNEEIVGVCNLFIDRPLSGELVRESIQQTVNMLAGETYNFRLAHQAPRPLIEAEERSSYFDLDPKGRLQKLSEHACREAESLPDVYRVILRLYNQDDGTLQFAACKGSFDQEFKDLNILGQDARYAVSQALRERTAVFINCVETYLGNFQGVGPEPPESHASICIFDDQHVVGVLSVDFSQPHALTDWVQEKLVHLGESIGKEFGQIQESIALQSLDIIEANAFRKIDKFNESKYLCPAIDFGNSNSNAMYQTGGPDPTFPIALPPNRATLATNRAQLNDLDYFGFCKAAHTNLYSSQSALYLINPESGLLEIKALVNQYESKDAVDKIPKSYGLNDKWYEGLIGWTLRTAERQAIKFRNQAESKELPAVLNLKNCFDLEEITSYPRPSLEDPAPSWKNMAAFRDSFIPLLKNSSTCERMALLCVPVRAFGELFGVLRFSYAGDRRDEFFSNFDVLKAQNVATRLANYLHYVESRFLNNVLQDFEADICQLVAIPRIDSSFESQCLAAAKKAICQALGPNTELGMLVSTQTYRNLKSSAPDTQDENLPVLVTAKSELSRGRPVASASSDQVFVDAYNGLKLPQSSDVKSDEAIYRISKEILNRIAHAKAIGISRNPTNGDANLLPAVLLIKRETESPISNLIDKFLGCIGRTLSRAFQV